MNHGIKFEKSNVYAKIVGYYDRDWGDFKWHGKHFLLCVFSWKWCVFKFLNEAINCCSIFGIRRICFKFFNNISCNLVEKNIKDFGKKEKTRRSNWVILGQQINHCYCIESNLPFSDKHIALKHYFIRETIWSQRTSTQFSQVGWTIVRQSFTQKFEHSKRNDGCSTCIYWKLITGVRSVRIWHVDY